MSKLVMGCWDCPVCGKKEIRGDVANCPSCGRARGDVQFYVKGYEDANEVGILTDWTPGFFRRRRLDDFDAVAFLNGDIYHFSEGDQ